MLGAVSQALPYNNMVPCTISTERTGAFRAKNLPDADVIVTYPFLSHVLCVACTKSLFVETEETANGYCITSRANQTMKFTRSHILIALTGVLTAGQLAVAFAPLPGGASGVRSIIGRDNNNRHAVLSVVRDESQSQSVQQEATPPPAILNGKRVMPATIIKAGLKGQTSKIAGVYALLSGSFQKGTEGWDAVLHVGVSQDLKAALDAVNVEYKHVRALSFSFPQPNAMQDVADEWKTKALEAGAEFQPNVVDASAFLFDDDEEDDDFDDEDDEWTVEDVVQAVASVPPSGGRSTSTDATQTDTVVSPFDEESSSSSEPQLSSAVTLDSAGLEMNEQTVDAVLEEVRPYLISDGGNVSVKGVNVETKTVYLQLEGACGSCPSSTVTMQMGIERVLKENFGADVKVEQVEDPDGKPTSLTMEMVQDEVDRIKPAIVAMGGVVRVLEVDAETGVVKLQFRGASRVQSGLELAIRDLPFVNAVQFVMGDDE
eukprot:scaffold7485_cov176-Amphora_coffeaeformis.AAC.17